jgi:hypothetical protein
VGHETHHTPIHKGAATVRCADRSQAQWGVFFRFDVRDEMSTIKTTHGVSEKVDASTARLGLELLIEGSCSREDGASSNMV